MNWRPVSELPSVYGNGRSENVMIWLTDGTHTEGYYSGGQWWLGKSGEPTHWSLITPPSEGVERSNHCEKHSETQLDCPECVATLPELTDAERDKMNAMGSDLIQRLWNGVAPSRTYCPDCGSYTETRLGSEKCTKDGCDFERFFSPPMRSPSEPDPSSALAEALEELMDWQNGPPLSTIKWTTGWNAAMEKARAAMALRRKAGE